MTVDSSNLEQEQGSGSSSFRNSNGNSSSRRRSQASLSACIRLAQSDSPDAVSCFSKRLWSQAFSLPISHSFVSWKVSGMGVGWCWLGDETLGEESEGLKLTCLRPGVEPLHESLNFLADMSGQGQLLEMLNVATRSRGTRNFNWISSFYAVWDTVYMLFCTYSASPESRYSTRSRLILFVYSVRGTSETEVANWIMKSYHANTGSPFAYQKCNNNLKRDSTSVPVLSLYFA